ncbi:hypothetical protein IMZ48_33890, partial [Candidatus Bathyarchaeota archaeon]|nr:hypothetical protein [Candidatus Bathyarchaeota archaeon]
SLNHPTSVWPSSPAGGSLASSAHTHLLVRSVTSRPTRRNRPPITTRSTRSAASLFMAATCAGSGSVSASRFDHCAKAWLRGPKGPTCGVLVGGRAETRCLGGVTWRRERSVRKRARMAVR